MKKSKGIVLTILVLIFAACLTGCASNYDKGSLKDNIIAGWDRWIQSFSKHALTKDKDLQGEKAEGVDAYTGIYTAVYDGFNGKEFIFGGTALNREKGNQLQVTYKLTVDGGTAELNWVAGNDEYTIANSNSEDTKEYTISSGDNYLVFKGENFSGSLEVTVKDVGK